jgi:hypothetical protein
MAVAATAAVLSVGVPLAAPSTPAKAAVGAVDPAESQTTPSRDTSTVTTTCTNGLIIVLASPFTVIPCATFGPNSWTR